MASQKGMRPGWLKVSARLMNRAYRLWLWIARPMTVGVRVVLVREGAAGQEVLLVRHTYHDGWLLPGGGVQKGETPEAAARREAREETGAELGELRLLGVFTNFHEHKSDHVIVFTCTDFRIANKASDRYEIDCLEFFPLDCLPGDLLPGHRRRIEAFLRGEAGKGFGYW